MAFHMEKEREAVTAIRREEASAEKVISSPLCFKVCSFAREAV